MLEDFVAKLKGFYYFFEDRYYAILDILDEKIPVYQVVDRVDLYVPSFLLLLLLLLFSMFGMLVAFGGEGGFLEPIAKPLAPLLDPIRALFAEGGPLEPVGKFIAGVFDPLLRLLGINQGTARFIVQGDGGEAIEGALVTLSSQGKSEAKTTDAFGEFRTTFFGKNVKVDAQKQGYENFSGRIDISPRRQYSIELASSAFGGLKKIFFELRDEQNNLIPATSDVSMEFSCTGQRIAPASFTKKGNYHAVLVQQSCGILGVTINATGYEQARENVEVSLQETVVKVVLSRKQLFADLRALVVDEDSGVAIEGVSLTLKSGGVTVIQAGSTDETGVKVIPRVPAGSYFIEAVPGGGSGYSLQRSDEFNVGALQFSSGEPYEITIALKRADSSRKLLVKFLDSSTQNPVAGASATLVIDGGVSSVSKDSGQNGSVEFINLPATGEFRVIAKHPDYVLNASQALEVSTPGAQKTNEVRLVKATSSNSGSVGIKVSDFAGQPVVNASTLLYLKSIPFPVSSARTGSSGIADQNNLPPGDYNAYAEKNIDGIAFSNSSGTKTLAQGQSIILPIVLVTTSGEIGALVVDSAGKPVAGAKVSFIDKPTGKKLAEEQTDSAGKTRAISLRADKRPFLRVQKAGYYTFNSFDYAILPNSKQTVAITLAKSEPPEFNSFDIQLVEVLKSDMRKATRIEDNKAYYFRFNVLAPSAALAARAVFRAGLEQNLSLQNDVVSIRGISSSLGSAVYSSCYTAGNNYADCDAGGAQKDAKQAVLSMGDINAGVYEVLVNAFVKEVADAQEDATRIEMRYGAKATIQGSVVEKPAAQELYLWSQLLNDSICTVDCGLEFELSLQDEGKEVFPSPLALEERKTYTLLQNVNYKVKYRIVNRSGENFENVSLKISNDNQALSLATQQVQIGRLANGSSAEGEFSFSTPKNTESAALDLNLMLAKKGESARVFFKVSNLKAMRISLAPDYLDAGKPNSILVKVTDTANKPVPNATIKIYSNESGVRTFYIGGTADAAGEFLAPFAAFAEGQISFDVNASKSGYIEATKSIGVGRNVNLLPKTDCITVNGAAADMALLGISQMGGSASFTVTNSSCKREVKVLLQKHSESDITIKKDGALYNFNPATLVSLPENASQTFQVFSDRQFGIHPIYLLAKFENSQTLLNAGTLRARVFDESTRLIVERLTGDGQHNFLLDLVDGKESLRILNNAYAGIEEAGYPTTDLYSTFRNTLVINPTETLRDRENGSSEQRLDIGIRQQLPNRFFLITAEDYYEGQGGG